jgi:hypothetical protein
MAAQIPNAMGDPAADRLLQSSRQGKQCRLSTTARPNNPKRLASADLD